jgi:hypothetical protein
MHTREYWQKQLYEIGTRKPELWEGTRQRLLVAQNLIPAEDEQTWTYLYVNELGWYLDGEEDPQHMDKRLQKMRALLPSLDGVPAPSSSTISLVRRVNQLVPPERLRPR